ncbi:hypothetical protein N0V87_009717 [Didymella glomerata]|uniref:Beta-xylanase n=1 Tax=Didymella glomerata TaxID=749621 RepID=A0A9W9BVR0_9PLEO|nr:hypothetical protein N0V87_009717 [Didymella glomerata]
MRLLFCLAAPLLVTGSPLSAECQDDGSVNSLFRCLGKIYFGAATEKAKIDTGKTGAIVKADFGQATNEYLMKWDQTEPSRNQFNLGPAGELVQFAFDNSKSIRGHTLVWGEALPQWVLNINDKATLTEVIQTHIKNVMVGPNGSWKGKIRAWDVVNEVIGDDGNLKNTHFYQVLGEEYIGIAFRAARQADPTAKLYINDYNLENTDFGQHKGMLKYVKKWLDEGIPIDGIGSQTHIKKDGANGLETALRELAEISNNLEVAVTELDVVGSDPPTYWKAVQACYHVPRCVGVTTWEVRDEPASNPIDTPNKALFKVNYDPKDAYYQIRDELINLKKSQL